MKRGPKPDPATVKRAKGNPGRRPIGDEPVPTAQAEAEAAPVAGVKPPTWLKGKALEVWTELAPRVVRLKLLQATDADTFGRYCRNFARWLKMQEELDSDGETYVSESAHGTLKRLHPAALYALRLDRELTASEANFGLNPAERQRIFAARAAQPPAGAGDLFGDAPPPAAAGKTPPASGPAKPGSSVGILTRH